MYISTSTPNSILTIGSEPTVSKRHDRTNNKRGILKRDIEQYSCPSTPKKLVTFDRVVKAYSIVHIAEYTERQKRNTWYNQNEYKRITRQMFASLNLQSNGPLSEEDRFHCFRGLEHLSPECHKRRQRLRQDARDTVLNAQILQDVLHIRDEDSLAQAYAARSAEAQQLAHARGLADAHAVLNNSSCLPMRDESSPMGIPSVA
jgi:hypothetical protein